LRVVGMREEYGTVLTEVQCGAHHEIGDGDENYETDES
jgi:hypothetical protein